MIETHAYKSDKLKEACIRFREAIEKVDPKCLPITFSEFPFGSCGHTTILLGTILKDKGFGRFEYVLGQKEAQSHAWLQQCGIIVDITADQFPEVQDKVIVTTDSAWHSLFREKEKRREANYNNYDASTKLILSEAYKMILMNITLA